MFIELLFLLYDFLYQFQCYVLPKEERRKRPQLWRRFFIRFKLTYTIYIYIYINNNKVILSAQLFLIKLKHLSFFVKKIVFIIILNLIFKILNLKFMWQLHNVNFLNYLGAKLFLLPLLYILAGKRPSQNMIESIGLDMRSSMKYMEPCVVCCWYFNW